MYTEIDMNGDALRTSFGWVAPVVVSVSRVVVVVTVAPPS